MWGRRGDEPGKPADRKWTRGAERERVRTMEKWGRVGVRNSHVYCIKRSGIESRC